MILGATHNILFDFSIIRGVFSDLVAENTTLTMPAFVEQISRSASNIGIVEGNLGTIEAKEARLDDHFTKPLPALSAQTTPASSPKSYNKESLGVVPEFKQVWA